MLNVLGSINNLTLTSLLLFGSDKETLDVNTKILNLIIQLLKDSGHFDESLIAISNLGTY